MSNVILAEDWNRNSWANWTDNITEGTTLPNTESNLTVQNHIDLATFISDNNNVSYAASDNTTLSIGYQSTLGNYPACIVDLNLPATAYTITATYSTPISFTGLQNSLLVLPLPNFPYKDMDLNKSYIKITSDTEDVTLSFASSVQAPSSQDAYNNSYLQYPWTSFSSIDIANVTSVIINLVATTQTTVNLAALRLIGANWQVSNVDYNNLDNQLCNCFPLADYDLITSPITPYDVPSNNLLTNIWRCSNPTGDDPVFINSSFGVRFNTGSIENTNTFTIYLRGSVDTPILESTLDGVLLNTLNGLPQPSTTQGSSINTFNIGCTLTWINNSTSATPINGQTVYQYQVQVGNNISGQNVYQFDSFESNGAGDEEPGLYMWNGLSPNTEYEIIFTLDDDTMQVVIYPVDQIEVADVTTNTYGFLGIPIFNSGVIKDTSTFFREPGRLGFFAELNDPDAYIDYIRPYNIVFGQFISNTYLSLTPMNGAQIYSNYTTPYQLFGTNPDLPLWNTLIGTNAGQPNTPVISNYATSTYVAFPYTSVGDTSQPGVISQLLTPFGDPVSGIVDFNNLNISLSLMPNALLLQGNLSMILVNDKGYGIRLVLPPLTAGIWNALEILVPEEPFIETSNINEFMNVPISAYGVSAGLYQIAFLYDGPSGATLSIGNEQVTQNAVAWFMRGVSPNPFEQSTAKWTNVNEVSYANDSVQFTPAMDSIQVRVDALQQDTEIYNGFAVSPTYAQLGKIITNPNIQILPYTFNTITATSSGRTFTFTASDSTGPTPINYVWSFGDGELGTGNNISHTYNETGYPQVESVTVFVTAYDYLGNVTTGMRIVEL